MTPGALAPLSRDVTSMYMALQNMFSLCTHVNILLWKKNRRLLLNVVAYIRHFRRSSCIDAPVHVNS